jgi:2-polyprenyl-6-methoxyphenol hydroxylase-like FAD-dependent oxidoreductase
MAPTHGADHIPPPSQEPKPMRPVPPPRRPVPTHHDVIVVGARCAGSATALLLARAGLRVLVLERAQPGSDTSSTLALMRAGVLQLSRWGVLDRIRAVGTPPVTATVFRYGHEVVSVPIRTTPEVPALFAPRRTVLDAVLAETASEAGAEVRYGVTVTAVVHDETGEVVGVTGRDGDGRTFEARADMTIGADGRTSLVARQVGAATTVQTDHAAAVVYGFWHDLEVEGYEWCYQEGATAGLIPTNEGAVIAFAATTPGRFRREIRPDLSSGYRALLTEAAPTVVDRLAEATAPVRLRSFPGAPGHLRRCWGPGWALVGDAGYFKDPITAHGMSDALRDAELLADAVVGRIGGALDDRAARSAYEGVRDRLSTGLLATTDALASFRWDLTEVKNLLHRLSGDMRAEIELLSIRTAPATSSMAVA